MPDITRNNAGSSSGNRSLANRSVREISIKWKLLTICILLVTLPTIFFGTLGYNAFKKLTNRNTEILLRKIALDWTQVADSYIKQADRLLRREEALVRQRLKAIAMSGRQLLSYADETGTIDLEKVMEKLEEIAIGRSGFVFLANGKGELLFPDKKEWYGENIKNFLSSDNTVSPRNLLPHIKQFAQDTGETFNFKTQDAATGQTRKQIAALTYFEKRDIILGALTYDTDYKSHKLEKQLQEELRYRIADQRIGENGYIYVINSHGEYVVSLDRMRDGENIIHHRDENGNYFIKEIIDNAKSLLSGETIIRGYKWQNLNQASPLKKISAFTYVPEWDWIIAASAYEIDYFKGLNRIRFQFIVFCAAVILVGSCVSYFFARHITTPLNTLSRLALKAAKGDLDAKIDDCMMNQPNEIGRLAVSFQIMTHNLNKLFKEKEVYSKELFEKNKALTCTRDNLEKVVAERTLELEERMRAEEEIRHLRNYLFSIINSMPSVLIVVKADGNVTIWNKTAERITGITAEAARGRYLPDVFHQIAPEMENVIESIQTRTVKHIQRKRYTGENKVCYDNLTIYPLMEEAEKSAVIRIDDTTEQVRMKERMVQSEKMMSVGGLAAGMAHEINNPLAGMMQNANVIKYRLESIDMPANLQAAAELGLSMEDIKAFMEKRNIFRMIDAIQESGARAAEIVNSMLRFARKSGTAVSSHYPDQLMDRILGLAATDYDLKKQYDFKSIEIIKEYADDLPMLPCEGANIQQVLLNILRNGAQAMHKAKTESPRFILRIYSKGKPAMVHIEIEDNGPGMDEQTRLKVFDPFFTTKPVGAGTGLGLSVSYFIITENHKGTMNVISEPGKGANFIIRLPVDGLHRKNWI
ncbi:MAG: Cache 3/Cache 2 fusion domain-containing protein [Desulfobacteraceae bacterium]